MAELEGKTGEQLEEAVIQKQTEQAEATELPTGAKIEPTKITEQDKELLTDANVKMASISAPVPASLDKSLFNQSAPQAAAAQQYQATEATSPADLAAAQADVSEGALMQGAQGQLSPEAMVTAQTAELDPRATVRYQLAEIQSSIEEGAPLPAWAAPAVRKVTSIMNARGLGSSSMAAAAMVQAIQESGIQIAAQDANKFATIQLQNLNNKQQAALQNATALANMDMANLNNRQQAAVNNAKTFLSIDVQNLTNRQQAATLNYQAEVQKMTSDQAAQNAASQFNAKSANEVDMFFAELGSQIDSANQNRAASIEQFNVNQKGAMDQFNANMEASRQQFNSNMQSTINQSNVAWRGQINTSNTATQNAANQANAQALLGLTQNSLNNLWQLYRDQAAWAMQISENRAERAHNGAMLSAQIDANASLYDTKFDNFLVTETITSIFD